ncbi:integrase [Gossypium australe]|uniref:Integrase n=1 Tax=Gossypium australe TaxID=47621 RepID=A0A5B6WTU3_9ROSI|nr:integrase [Gossypium australe]
MLTSSLRIQEEVGRPLTSAFLPKPKSPLSLRKVMVRMMINIPLLDVIKQVPSYAKFLKDMCTIKRKHNHITPPKYKDPSCPTISCIVGNTIIECALLDLGATINLFPFSVYQQLVDFIVLDTHPVLDSTLQIPVILGHPFLVTSNALINFRNGVLNLFFRNMTLV